MLHENLENGDPINILFRIPENLNKMAAFYQTMKVHNQHIKSDLEKPREREKQDEQLVQ